MQPDSSPEPLPGFNLHRPRGRCEKNSSNQRSGAIAPILTLLAVATLGCDPKTPTAPPAAAVTQAIPTPPLEPSLREAFVFIEQGRPDVARVRVRRAMTDDAPNAQAAFLMGLAHHVERRHAKALPWFEQSCAAPDVYPPAWHFKGWALFWLGRPDEAQSAFEHHLCLTPDEGDSHFAIGLIELERANWDEAEARFNRAIQLQEGRDDRVDGQAKAMARLAEVIEQRDGDLERAQQLLAEALDLQGDLHEAGFRRARLLRRLGRVEEAQVVEQSARSARDAQAHSP
ncbi:MAG: tetratricopeptide repeat protein [Phycisphaerales bacterium]|nr:tetratricopeptide repeat protein [Phycisphaerales bacterium]